LKQKQKTCKWFLLTKVYKHVNTLLEKSGVVGINSWQVTFKHNSNLRGLSGLN